MNFINNLAIKKKLLLLIALPLIGLLYFSITQNLSLYSEIKKTEKYEIGIHFAKAISNLLHETQKERGFTAGFIGSGGKKFANELIAQRKETNAKYKLFLERKAIMHDSFHSPLMHKSIQAIIKKLKNIDNVRNKVDGKDIKVSDAIAFYTKTNNMLLKAVVVLPKLTDDAHLSLEITAFANFILSKERVGIERAIGANTLSRDSFAPGLRAKLDKLISEQSLYIDSFKDYATADSVKFYEETVKGKAVEEVIRIREILQK